MAAAPQMNEDGHVSISRRGLIAAGLAVAAVGTMGVVSTMNASASDTPAAVIEDAGPDGATTAGERAENPPALLPTGAVPRPVRRGWAGASSRALAAAGASAAADVTPASANTTEFGPKGLSGEVKTAETSIAPPLPPLSAKASEQQVTYLYANGKQAAVTDGVSAMFTVAKPAVGGGDWHSLAEMAVQSADHKQTVEVGWTVDPVLFNDNETHLFVYHWVNGQETCYNCNFVPYSRASVKPGDILAEGSYKLFGVQHYNGAWWIAYDTEWIGSFPDSLWDGDFTQSGNVQLFGEVASSTTTNSCSQMGNSKSPDDTTAAKIGSVTYVNGPTVRLTLQSTVAQYAAQFVSENTVRTFRYGGDRSC